MCYKTTHYRQTTNHRPPNRPPTHRLSFHRLTDHRPPTADSLTADSLSFRQKTDHPPTNTDPPHRLTDCLGDYLMVLILFLTYKIIWRCANFSLESKLVIITSSTKNLFHSSYCLMIRLHYVALISIINSSSVN